MVPTVVIEMAASDRPSPLAAILVEACSEGVAVGKCALAGEREDEPAAAVAIVVWTGAGRSRVRIEVGLHRASRAEWLSRAIDFRPEDVDRERWRAAGLVIATLVGETFRAHPEAAPQPTTLTAAAPAPSGPTTTTSGDDRRPAPRDAASVPAAPRGERAATGFLSRERLWLDLGGVLGPGLDDGAWRRGGWLRAEWAPSASPAFFVASARYAGRPADDRGVSVHWMSASLGAGIATTRDAFRAEARAELVLGQVRASVLEESTRAADSAERGWVGARLGLDAVWMATRRFGLLLGGEAALVPSATEVRLHGLLAGKDQPFGGGIVAGARGILW